MDMMFAPASLSSIEQRRRLIGEIALAIERARRRRARAGLVVAQSTAQAGFTASRLAEVIEARARCGRDRVQSGPLGADRYALVIAPIGFADHAYALRDQLARAVDPRSCPLLRASQPCVWFGVGVFPDHGVEAHDLLAHTQADLEYVMRAAPENGSSADDLPATPIPSSQHRHVSPGVIPFIRVGRAPSGRVSG